MKLIPLSGKHGEGLHMKVDDEDYEWLIRHTWHAHIVTSNRLSSRLSGARTTIATPRGYKKTLAHKLITGYQYTDHKDNDVLNNQRANLRSTTRGDANQPPRNGGTSKYKGVDKRGNRWHAQLYKGNARKGSQVKYLSAFFDNEIAAAVAYDKVARKVHGDMAWLNYEHFPEVPC